MKRILYIGLPTILVLFVAFYLGYSGFFTAIEIQEREIGPYHFVLKERYGNYDDTQAVIDSIQQIVNFDGITSDETFAIYYDSPMSNSSVKTVLGFPTKRLYGVYAESEVLIVNKNQCMSIVGLIIEEDNYNNIKRFKRKYRLMTMGKTKSLVVEFPLHNKLSFLTGSRAYLKMKKYAKEKNYSINHPLEIYTNDKIIYSMEVKSK